jgi:predicted homoserine dehydrogenase-like protein
LQPIHGMRTNVHTYAKRDLKAGDLLDGMGGFNSYGLIENLADDPSNTSLPILLNDNLKLKRDIAKDQRIGLADVEYNAHDKAFQLYFKALGRDAAPETIKVNSVGTNLQYA